MSYSNRGENIVTEAPARTQIVEYHDRVRWGPIFAGIVTALATQLVLSAIGAAIGASSIAGSGAPRSEAGGVGSAVGIWSIVSLFLSLLVGGWIAARTSGPMNRSTALLNGAILWAATLALGSWLLASGISGAFGALANNAGEIVNQAQQGGANLPNSAPNVSAQQARDLAGNTAKASWSFAFGSLLGLVASLIGSSLGARNSRNSDRTYV